MTGAVARRALLALLPGLAGCAVDPGLNAEFDAAAAAELARRPALYANGNARAFSVSGARGEAGVVWGTWHVSYDSVTGLPRRLRQRFTVSRRLVVEQVLDEATLEQRLASAAIVRDGLAETDPRALNGLDAVTMSALATAGIRGADLRSHSLLGLATLVTARAAPVEPGLFPTVGTVDLDLIGFARSAGLPVLGLEPIDAERFRRIFYADPNGPDAAAALRLALRRRESWPRFRAWLREQYRAGQIGAMLAATTAWQADPDDLRRAEALRAPLLTERNKAWLPQLEAILGEDGPTFVAFGAAHLVGRDGIVAGLRDKGWSVEPLLEL